MTDVRGVVAGMERHQVPLYLSALAAGALVGLLLPRLAGTVSAVIPISLGLLLYATFLAVPFASIVRALRDRRFLLTVGIVNFAVVPIVVWGLSLLLPHDRAVLVGALFVLLAPCVDYVIVFTGLAGGARDRLLAATPLLMLCQMLLLPVFLRWFGWAPRDPERGGASDGGLQNGAEGLSGLDPVPFIEAFVLLILLPLLAAALTQLAARTTPGARLQRIAGNTMVPLMMLTLATVVAAQIEEVVRNLSSLLRTMLVFLLFAAVMVLLGMLAARVARLDTAASRALVFSGVTRNSLVVLPLVLALPDDYSLASAVVVSQTLVELLAMVAMVRLVPRLIPGS